MVKCAPDCQCGKHRRNTQIVSQEVPTCEHCGASMEACEDGCWDLHQGDECPFCNPKSAAPHAVQDSHGQSWWVPGVQASQSAVHERSSETTPSALPAEIYAPELKLTYHERGHRYYLNGKRASGVSTVAKIAADDYQIRLWHERMVALGVTIDANLRENVAMHAENKGALEELCEDAKKVAKAHLKADRGSQKHRVLELVLLGQEDKLITDQQRMDAIILKRTLDRYKLTPHGLLAEQFVVYPQYNVCGRFDAVLDFETADGRTCLVDLKSGSNAVLYPHSTGAQLALYTNTPHISVGEHRGDRIDVTEFSTMPAELDHDVAYVLLVENDAQVGTLHEIDINHGWKAAQLALDLLAWRKQYGYQGRGMVREVCDHFTYLAAEANSEIELREVWKAAAQNYCLTEELKTAIMERREALTTPVSDESTQTAQAPGA